MITKIINGEEYVLIIRTSTGILGNEGRWGESESGFYIKQPISGLIRKEYWDGLKIFQSLNIPDDWAAGLTRTTTRKKSGEVIRNEIPSEEQPEIVKQWLKLQQDYKAFYNTVEEFLLVVGIDKNGDLSYRRCASILGDNEWKEV